MLALYRSLSLRFLRRHWDRALLVVLSIALGVATLVSTRLLNNCLSVAVIETTTPLAESADLYVSNGEIGVPLDLARTIREAQVPGVAGVFPILLDRVEFPELQRKALLVGVDLPNNSASSPPDTIAEPPTIAWFPGWPAKMILTPSPVVILGEDIEAARKQKGMSGDTPLIVRYGGARTSCTPAGVITFHGSQAKLGGNILAVEIAAGTRLLGRSGQINRIDIKLAPGADREQVRLAVQQRIGSTALVVTPEQEQQANEDIIGGIQVGFTVCSIGALVIGLFLVYNALSVSVAERRHEIGILRSLGATREQIAALFTGEALFLGFAGAVLGVPLGSLLARTAIDLVGSELEDVFLTDTIYKSAELSVPIVALAVSAGLAVALFAALVPAMQAAADEPADAVRRAPTTGAGWAQRLHRALCVLLILGGIGTILLRHRLPYRPASYGGMVAFLIGNLLAMPIYVSWVANLLRPLLRLFLGIEERLAADNLLRSPGRTGVVIGALAAGVALMVQIAGVGRSNEEPVLDWIDRAVTADYFVVSGSLATASSSLEPMADRIAGDLRDLRVDEKPLAERIVGLRFLRPDFNGTKVFLIGMDAESYHAATLARSSKPMPNIRHIGALAESTRPALLCGSFAGGIGFTRALPEVLPIVVSDNFLEKHEKQPGDEIVLQGPSSPVRLRILGAIPDYSWNKGTIILDRSAYSAIFRDPYVDYLHVFLNPATPREEGVRVLTNYVGSQALMMQDRASVREYISSVIQRVYQLAYMQQVVVGVVAALGVVTALLISVLQRKRELGLLRAVGATQSQIMRTVLAEALLMGILGMVLGVLIGLPLQWYILKVVISEESGFVFEMLIPWRAGLGIGAMCILLAALAGILPALRAVRQNIAEAIAYE